MGNATRASRGKPHIFLTVENRVGPASRFRDSQSTAQPLRLHFGLGFYSFGLFCNLIRLNSLIIGFLFVVPLPCYVASSIPNITVRDLPFTTLGCRYPRPDFHRLDVRHARRTNTQSSHKGSFVSYCGVFVESLPSVKGSQSFTRSTRSVYLTRIYPVAVTVFSSSMFGFVTILARTET